jgi:predicted branched-subunit amino acid permease
MPSLTDARAGAAAIAPMLLGVVPFGLVAGAAPVAEGFDGWAAVGLSTLVFAGASQLAIVDVLSHSDSAAVAILAALTINLRMVLYSASLAPYLGHESTGRRLGAAYLLNDQVYALSVPRWAADDRAEGRLAFYMGAAVLLWVGWVAATIGGVVLGAAVPESVPLDFAVPLVFLVLLVPVLVDRPSVVAAVTGGAVAVIAAEAGAGPLSMIVGAVAGIAAGTVVDARRREPASP